MGEQLVQGIPAPPLRLHDEAAPFNRDPDPGTRLQVQDIEQRGWYGQHDRTADLAQIGSVHDVPIVVIFQYNFADSCPPLLAVDNEKDYDKER